MGLFQRGDFKLNSGAKSQWKIECDALDKEDWATAATMVIHVLDTVGIESTFGRVVGVPQGGILFAAALKLLETGKKSDGLLIVDDVLTTGGSMDRFRDKLPKRSEELMFLLEGGYIGIVLFARGKCPGWITPIFQMPTTKIA